MVFLLGFEGGGLMNPGAPFFLTFKGNLVLLCLERTTLGFTGFSSGKDTILSVRDAEGAKCFKTCW